MLMASSGFDTEEYFDANDGPSFDDSPTYYMKINKVTEDLIRNDASPTKIMESDAQNPTETTLIASNTPQVIITPRTYQLELLEESLKRNIIVAMDTGSGKTHVAILRVLHELDRMASNQFIWFLAPTVSLCAQQFDYVQTQISFVQVKFLSGNDGVDRWSEQSLWDSLLKNVKIVVSTYQILLDALSNGFVRLDSLALIVFDEVHNCVGKSAGAKIMQSFYQRQKAQGKPVPNIIALTASPVFRSNPNSLFDIEKTMDAVAKTPTKHRSELRLQVKLPILVSVSYTSSLPEPSDFAYPSSLLSLGQEYHGLRLADDPYVKYLINDGSGRSLRELEKIRLNHKTWSQSQIKALLFMSSKVFQELGPWATDLYISEVIQKHITMTEDDIPVGVCDLSAEENRYVSRALSRVKIEAHASFEPDSPPLISDKAAKLIQVLLQEQPEAFSGIIFVQERAMVSVLSRVLSLHPETKDRFRIASMVGTSSHSRRDQRIGELVDMSVQKNALADFKSGACNLVIATSVLEEGIDVPICNIVICFQKPANLKSFVQRRGRARQRKSKLVLLLDPKVDKMQDWEEAEQAMKKLYEDEMQALQDVLVIEDTEKSEKRELRVESTGALLNTDNAIARLYHFCSTLPAKEYVDLRPEFICSKSDGSMLRARVILPLCVNEAVRVTESSKAWKSEKNAIRDTAFEAYVSLYRAGLVDDHLLPLMQHDEMIDELTTAVETRASIVTVSDAVRPWNEVAKAWNEVGNVISSTGRSNETMYQCDISIGELRFTMYLPVSIPSVPPIQVYWNSKTEITIKSGWKCRANTDCLGEVTQETLSMLRAAYGHRFAVEQKRPVMLFASQEEKRISPPLSHDLSSKCSGLIRDKLESNVAYIFQKWLEHKPPKSSVLQAYDEYETTPQEAPHLSLHRLPRRLDFLHQIPPGNSPVSSKPYQYVLPASRCTIDEIPFKYVQFALFIPSIMRRYEIYMIAEHLSNTILKDVEISDLSVIVTAICASSANEESNYQRLEFLGDSVLKLCASVQLTAEYALWHEGYLSAKKDRLVANSRLARAAVEVGLDRYIITKGFTGHKWRPLFVEDLAQPELVNEKRELSSKILADVVEALIGASMLDGGIPKALACLRVFLPELNWQSLLVRQSALYQRVPEVKLPSTLQVVEELIGYDFTKKGLLIEALTHASYNASASSTSLERLEFLGDSVLDFVIVSCLQKCTPELSHVQMHLLRAALVNADFLAFSCMEYQISQERCDVVEVSNNSLDSTKGNKRGLESDFSTTTSIISFPLWSFLRHASPRLAAEQKHTMKRHAELRDAITEAIENGKTYPWALLARLQAGKWYSDLIESIIGAMWVDCGGDWDIVEKFVGRLGIVPYLKRIISEKVRVRHPKEEVGIWAGNRQVKYVLSEGNNWKKTPGGTEAEGTRSSSAQAYNCKIFIGGQEIVEIGCGVGREEVKTRAAEVAIEMLERGEVILEI